MARIEPFEVVYEAVLASGDAAAAVEGRWQLELSKQLTLGSCGISIDLSTGEVTLPAELNLSEASRAFWDAVQRLTGQRCGFD